MGIKVKVGDKENFLSAFATIVGTTVKKGRVNIPSKYGSGYVIGFLYGNQLRMIVRHYKLNEDLLIERHKDDLLQNMIQLSFKNILADEQKTIGEKRKQLPSVSITTQGLQPEVNVPGNTSFNAINISIEAGYLKQLLDPDIKHPLVKNIIENRQPLIVEQLVSAELQQVASEITGRNVPASLQRFFYKLKAEELICYLLMELVKREDSNVQPINVADSRMLYVVRDKLISDLAAAPALSELAIHANMSESKLKRLFKQVFGNSIYNYYQTMRMKEAAYLLRQEKRSVSEVGYTLGFSNLSHFTRVFEEHIGMKPKKYSVTR